MGKEAIVIRKEKEIGKEEIKLRDDERMRKKG